MRRGEGKAGKREEEWNKNKLKINAKYARAQINRKKCSYVCVRECGKLCRCVNDAATAGSTSATLFRAERVSKTQAKRARFLLAWVFILF